MTRILIVEDNTSLALGLQRGLEAAGFEVRAVEDVVSALADIEGAPADLIVLDLMLPGRDGFHFLEELRARRSDIPVLILSARGEELDKLRGFRLGADDYVVKPVGLLELIARVEAILRRADAHRDADPLAGEYRFGDVVVDTRRRMVAKAGEPVDLSPLEFDLLLCLLRNDGAVVGRDKLLTGVWGYKRPTATRTIDTHVGNLRAKLEDDASNPTHILTVRKVGYRLCY